MTILVKKHLHSLSHEYYKKLFFGFLCFYIHQLITLQVYVKKNFFALFLVQMLPFQMFFFQKRFISNFSCRQLCSLCDLWLESSWGVDFKYIYCYGWKTFHSPYIESYHICPFPEKVCKLTFAWILPKIISWIQVFLHKLIDKLLSVC